MEINSYTENIGKYKCKSFKSKFIFLIVVTEPTILTLTLTHHKIQCTIHVAEEVIAITVTVTLQAQVLCLSTQMLNL